MRPYKIIRFFCLLILTLGGTPLLGGEILNGVKSRGVLRCGVSEGIPGFSEQDPSGRWKGIDADFCRAVAAAVIGDEEKVEFVPLTTAARFPALQARKIDLMARNTTCTLIRETVMGIQFPATLFYDGQTFQVPAESPFKQAPDLQAATICVQKSTTSELNLRAYFKQRGLAVTPLALDSSVDAAKAFFTGRCQAYTSDSAQLAGARLLAPAGRAAYRIRGDASRPPLFRRLEAPRQGPASRRPAAGGHCHPRPGHRRCGEERRHPGRQGDACLSQTGIEGHGNLLMSPRSPVRPGKNRTGQVQPCSRGSDVSRPGARGLGKVQGKVRPRSIQ